MEAASPRAAHNNKDEAANVNALTGSPALTVREPEPAAAAHPAGAGVEFTANAFSTTALGWLVAVVLLFALCTKFDDSLLPGPGGTSTTATHTSRYGMFQDTHVMMAVGFGFLYTLLRRYAWSGVGYNFLLCAVVFLWAILCSGFWENVRGIVSGAAPGFSAVPLRLETLVGADYTVATILISFGALLGRTSPAQTLHLALLETVFATGNASLATHLRASDAGGSMVIHVFGAAFGLAFAAAFGDAPRAAPGGEAKLGTTRHNGTFAMIGTVFLFCFWPSFNAALLEDPSAGRAIINTTLAIAGSNVVAFALSRALHAGAAFDMDHVQNATLAGGVAIGAACDMILNPGAALATGVVAGAVSTLGFSAASPALKRAGAVTDTCGILDLHFVPGVIGGVASALAALGVTGAAWPPAAVAAAFPLRGDRSPAAFAAYQAAVLATSLAIGAASGGLCGALLRGGAAAEPLPAGAAYEDAATWRVPAHVPDSVDDAAGGGEGGQGGAEAAGGKADGRAAAAAIAAAE